MNIKPIHIFFKKHQNLTNYCFLAIVFTTSYQGILIFDRDAHRSGPTIHFVGDKTLVQNLLNVS